MTPYLSGQNVAPEGFLQEGNLGTNHRGGIRVFVLKSNALQRYCSVTFGT
jgi:hypothetical protein